MNFDHFFTNILASLISGSLLAFIFFLLKERVFKTIDLNGSWVYEQKTVVSSYNPYVGMTLRYLCILASDGKTIYGSAEKIYEKPRTGRTWNMLVQTVRERR